MGKTISLPTAAPATRMTTGPARQRRLAASGKCSMRRNQTAKKGESVAEQAHDRQMAVEQAENVARLAGKMPAGAQRCVEASKLRTWIGGSSASRMGGDGSSGL
jgi:hypothetical protein